MCAGPDSLHPLGRHQVPARANEDPTGDQEQVRRGEIHICTYGRGLNGQRLLVLVLLSLLLLLLHFLFCFRRRP